MSDKEYVVYVAYSEEGDKCLYVGSGTKERPKHISSGISHVYEANRYHFQGKTPIVEIVASGLSKEESLDVEKEKIIELNPAWNRVRYEIIKDESSLGSLSLSEKIMRKLLVSGQVILRTYCENIESDECVSHVNAWYSSHYPILKDLVDVIGIERIKSYNYQWKVLNDIYKQLIDLDRVSSGTIATDYLQLKVGEFYSFVDLKKMVEYFYAEYDVSAAPKATDILNWYECKQAKKRGKNGYLILK